MEQERTLEENLIQCINEGMMNEVNELLEKMYNSERTSSMLGIGELLPRQKAHQNGGKEYKEEYTLRVSRHE